MFVVVVNIPSVNKYFISFQSSFLPQVLRGEEKDMAGGPPSMSGLPFPQPSGFGYSRRVPELNYSKLSLITTAGAVHLSRTLSCHLRLELVLHSSLSVSLLLRFQFFRVLVKFKSFSEFDPFFVCRKYLKLAMRLD